VIILRHSSSGAPQLLAKRIDASVINAGDGAHEHPSQALLDMMTVMEHKGKIEGLKLAIIGDIAHSRVAVSDIIGFTRMGAEVRLAGPQTFMPAGISSLGATICGSVQEAVQDADVVMTLRIQLERQNDSLIPSLREYSRFYGVNRQLMELAKEDAIVMHPGPINRGVELSPDVADGKRSVILDQVTNGVAVRMALLYLVLGGNRESEVQGESR
jgi:aspartate carbamoyltransferase catalytic subunit